MTGLAGRWREGLAGLVLFAVLLAVVLTIFLQPARDFAPSTAPLAGTLQPAPIAVAPGLYLLGRTTPAAAYLVETVDGLVLVDSGLEDDAANVLAQIGELRLSTASLRAVLLTHVHADHSLGAEHLRERTGAKVYAGRDDCLPLRTGGPREAFFSTFAMPDRRPHATTVDVELVGGETLAFGGTRFTAVATPGHTPGSVCYVLERSDVRALFTGDVVQHLDPDGLGSLGTYAAYLPPLYRGNATDYLESLRRLRRLPAPDLVLPGHPRMDGLPQSPRPTAERWHGLLDRGIGEMERLLARYEADGADFLDGTPCELLPGLHYLGDFGGSAVYCLDTPKGLFLFDAPGDGLLDAFLANRFRKLGWDGRKITAVLLTSADRRVTASLPELARGGCLVVAPKAGLDEVRRLLPAGTELLNADDLEGRAWFDVRVVPLAGRGTAPVAYQIRHAGKTVLLPGRIPTKIDETTAQELLREVSGPAGAEYLTSLDRLGQVKPDLWLPAVPVHGQNANVYDQEWARVLTQNRRLFR
jgi:glyoxylase-like metal-dependent hydrolase (beta-lactamase superfamily II)